MNKPLVAVRWVGDVAVVTVDHPPVNALSQNVRHDLLRTFEDLRLNARATGVVVRCQGKTFFAGADIREFDGPPQPPHLQDVFDAIESMAVPVVAAVHGTALGGGFEAALACHYRMATPEAKLALPEINLGIFPGAGGTQRLPRLVPLDTACEIILTTKTIDATEALRLGILDVLAEGDLETAAVAWLARLLREGRGPRPLSHQPVRTDNDAEKIFEKWTVFAKTRLKGRESPLKALAALRAAIEKPYREGLRIERTLNLECKQTVESRALRHIFFAEREARKVQDMSSTISPVNITHVVVLGAGTMGSGIAMTFANKGFAVTLVEDNKEALSKGLNIITSVYAEAVAKGRLTAHERERRLSAIVGSLNFHDVREADVVIEAVFEDLALKKKVFANLGALCKKNALLATNTSSLDVNDIASASGRPTQVVGLHFFSPAQVMPLVEIVRGAQTSPQSLATALALTRNIGKTSVVSGVCFGFIGNRMLLDYAREAQRMLLEGMTPREVDSALEQFGFAMGVLAVSDLAGVDVGVRVRREHASQLSKDPAFFRAAAVLYEAGRYGQKVGKGFYRYDDKRTRLDDPESQRLIAEAAHALGIARTSSSAEEIVERCVFPLINEGANLLAEGIALRASDIDVVWTSGYGFPRHRGGPMFYADCLGLKTVLAGIEKYKRKYGDEFWTPSPLLLRLVNENKTFGSWDARKT